MVSNPISDDLDAHTRAFANASASDLHRAKVELAKLTLNQAPPSAQNQLALAERFLEGAASAAELRDARQDAWAYVGSLACYCSASDSASAQAVLACLESDESAHTVQSLREQIERILRCRIPHGAISSGLERASRTSATRISSPRQ